MKAKNCNTLSETDMQIINKIDRNLLFPLSKELKDKLQMRAKETERTPKPMNNFIVFRRCLNFVVKESLSYDGKNLSRVAARIWKEATKEEKRDYTELAKLLKEQHSIMYPGHVERRSRKKRRINFVYYKSTNPQLNGSCGDNIDIKERQGISYNNYTPATNEYGRTDGFSAISVQQQYQQNSFYYSIPEECQHFYAGDPNAGFNNNYIYYGAF